MSEIMRNSFSVKVEVFDENQKKAVLNVSGPVTMSYIKAEQICPGITKEELSQLLLKRIGFEELEGALEKEPENYLLGTILKYLDEIEEEANDPVLSGLYRIQRNTKKFLEELQGLDSITIVKIHQLHSGASEECDFMDYLNIPFEEEEDAMREYLEENLSASSDIDQIMEHFEDGEFYIDSYEADELLNIDLIHNRKEKTTTVSEVC